MTTPQPNPQTTGPTIDAHHHLWHYTPDEFDWLEGPLTPLRRDFLPADLVPALQAAHVDATIAVQARQSLDETTWLLAQAAATPQIRGVIGWAPIATSGFLDLLPSDPLLKGLRHVVQAEPDPNFLLHPAFNAGIRTLTPTGLVYDLLIHQHQLPQAIAFVDLHPNQPFVLDHIAKPGIAHSELEPWATHFRDLARRPTVACKLSGLVTEAAPGWTPAGLTPYLDIALEAFTPARLIAASDWPVCLPATSYDAWWTLLRTFVAPLSTPERQAILGANATRIYNL